jgi:hypothetical protein
MHYSQVVILDDVSSRYVGCAVCVFEPIRIIVPN